MSIAIAAVLSQNITLVYDKLDLQAIGSSKLKGLVGGDIKAIVMDTPEMIVAAYPPTPVTIQMGDKRIRITLQQENEDIGCVPLWIIAANCHQLVLHSQLIAYGFNYDAEVKIANANAQTIIKDLFLSNQQVIENTLEGHLLSFTPRLQFERDGTLYDLMLELLDEEHIKAHLNAHFGDRPLPAQDQLEASFRQEYEYLVLVLTRLFGGGT